MNPLSTDPLFGDGPAELFRDRGPDGLDPYRTFFVARLTAKARVNGAWRYAWDEQTFDAATGLPADANPRRSGTADASPAVEVNDAALDLGGAPVYAFVRQKGVVNGDTYYEFCAGAGAPLDDGSGSEGPCPGAGFLLAYDAPTDCLTIALDGGPATPFAGGLVINGVTYTAALAAAGKALTLSAGGSGGATAGRLGCETCKCATFLFRRASFYDEPLPKDPCDRLLRITVCQTCCAPRITADGWYCVRDAGTEYPCAAVYLTAAEDGCRTDVEICSGPYATRAAAEAYCPTTVELVPDGSITSCQRAFMSHYGWTALPKYLFVNIPTTWEHFVGCADPGVHDQAGCNSLYGSRVRLEFGSSGDGFGGGWNWYAGAGPPDLRRMYLWCRQSQIDPPYGNMSFLAQYQSDANGYPTGLANNLAPVAGFDPSTDVVAGTATMVVAQNVGCCGKVTVTFTTR